MIYRYFMTYYEEKIVIGLGEYQNGTVKTSSNDLSMDGTYCLFFRIEVTFNEINVDKLV